MDLKTLIPLAPLALRPVLSHVVVRFEAQEAQIEALRGALLNQSRLVGELVQYVQAIETAMSAPSLKH
jgi:hypothetical protein